MYQVVPEGTEAIRLYTPVAGHVELLLGGNGRYVSDKQRERDTERDGRPLHVSFVHFATRPEPR
jgi:hypothetical protein